MGWIYGFLILMAALGLVELGFQLFASPEHRRQVDEIERRAQEQLRKERLEALRLGQASRRADLVHRREPLNYRRTNL